MEQLFENGELFLTFGKKWPVFTGLRRKKILAIPLEIAYTQGVWWGKVGEDVDNSATLDHENPKSREGGHRYGQTHGQVQ